MDPAVHNWTYVYTRRSRQGHAAKGGRPVAGGRRQRRGFGKLRTLPSGRYQASYVGPDLIRHTAPDTFDAREDAEAWLAVERRLIGEDDWTPPKTRRRRALTGRTLASYAPAAIPRRTNKDGEPLRP